MWVQMNFHFGMKGSLLDTIQYYMLEFVYYIVKYIFNW